MPGLLITPDMYFRDLFGRQKRDFAGWEVNIIDMGAQVVTVGELNKLTFALVTEPVSMEFKWAARLTQNVDYVRLVGADLSLSLDMSDHFGSSHDDGGCHFNPGLDASESITLVPPGYFQNGPDAEIWARIKKIGTGEC